MIFKTFDSKIDKWTSKIGIFGKSFDELGTAVNEAFKSVIDNLDNFDKNVGFWESLKNNLLTKPVDKDWIKNSFGDIISKENIDSYIKELDLESAKEKLADIFDWENLVKSGEATWGEYFEPLKDGTEKYIPDLIKNTDDLSKLEGQDLVDACNEAREAIINHNHELQNMSFSAKAGKVALEALATVGNMVLFAFISKGIELFVSWIDKLVHSSEYAQKAIQSATDSAKSFSQAIKDIQKNTVDMETGVNSIAKRYAQLSQGVNPFTNENKSLPTDEYEEFLDLNEQLTGLFPSLTRNYDENGNAILGLSGSVDSVTESIKALVEQEKELSKAKIRENIEKYFDGTDEADGAWKALEGRKEALEHANKELEELTNTYYGLIHSDEKINIGRFHKNFVNAEKKEYLNYIKDSFGEDIADAVEQVTSIHLGMGLNNQSADLIVDFSKLELTETQKEQIVRSYDTFYSDLIAKQKTAMSEFDSQNSEFSNNAMLWLEDLSFYKDNDKYIQTAVQNLVRSINWSNYTPEELDYNGVKRILQDSILTPFQTACDNPDTKEKLNGALTGLFTMDTTDMPAADITSQVNSYIDTIATAISNDNSTELKIRLGFGDTDDAVRRLQNSIRTITDDHGQSDHEEYAALSEFTQNFTQAQIELWLKSTQGAKNAAEAVQMYKDGLKKHTFSLTETQSQSIDEFQSKVKTLSDTLAALNSGTFSQADMTDLLQEFPQLAGETDNLQNAIQELINTLLYDLYAALSADIPQELKDSLRAIADEAGRTSSEIKTVADAISDVSSLHSVMQSFSEELSSGTISADTLGNIAAKYPQLEDAVNAYCMGLITEQELYGQLSEQYDNACLAFQAANRAKIYENELFYQNALETHDELVENLKTTYQIDFKNFTSLEVAKKEAELKLIGELSNMWYKYYDIVMGADGLYRVQSTGFGESYDEQNSQIYQDMSDRLTETQKIS